MQKAENDVAVRARLHAGKWQTVSNENPTVADFMQIQRGLHPDFPPPNFEAQLRSVKGRSILRVRYVSNNRLLIRDVLRDTAESIRKSLQRVFRYRSEEK